MCEQSFVPKPAYKIGDRVEIRMIDDDTRELDIECGVVAGCIYVADRLNISEHPGWNYRVLVGDRPSGGNDYTHESELTLIQEVQPSEQDD